MEEIIKEALQEDEKLVWSGKCEKFETLDAVCKPAFTKSCVVAVVAFAVVSALYLWAVHAVDTDIKPVLFAFFALVCAFKPITYFTDAAKLKKSVIYALTDKRILVLGSSRRDMPLGTISSAELKKDAAGHVSLLCGEKAMKTAPAGWRNAALFSQNYVEEGKACESFVFYAIEDVEGFKNAAKAYLPL